MSQLPAVTGWVHAPAAQTSPVHERPSLVHAAPSWFDQAVALVAGAHHWQAFEELTVPAG
jgi:hypothetical protein